MGNCAELCAKEKGIPRAEQDEFAAETYRRALHAQKEGTFKARSCRWRSPQQEGRADRRRRRGAGAGQHRQARRAAPRVPEGRHDHGRQRVVDQRRRGGAGADVGRRGGGARLEAAREASSARGDHAQAPEWFTTAPAEAISDALAKAAGRSEEVDLWEINEAFAVVSIANNQMLGARSGEGEHLGRRGRARSPDRRLRARGSSSRCSTRCATPARTRRRLALHRRRRRHRAAGRAVTLLTS